jgi:hypothetical protein
VLRSIGSYRRPSPYHLGATRSIEVVEAGHRTLTVIWGRCCAVRLLHFAAAPFRLPLTLNRQRHSQMEMSDTGTYSARHDRTTRRYDVTITVDR